MRIWLASLILASLSLAPNAWAFTCARETPLERMDRADVVFEGIIINSARYGEDPASQHRLTELNRISPQKRTAKNYHQVYVTEAFKGDIPGIVELWTDDWSYRGAGLLTAGMRAVFYADYSAENGKFLSDPCLAIYMLRDEGESRPLTADDLKKEFQRFEFE